MLSLEAMQKVQGKYKTAYFLLVINSILWGIAPVFIKLGYDSGFDTPTFLYYRFLIVGIIMAIFFAMKGKLLKSLKLLLKPYYFVNMLLINPINIILSFWGVERTTAMLASIASATKPIIADIVGVAMLKEKMSKSEILGTILAFLGIGVLIFLQNTNGEIHTENIEQSTLGVLLVVVSGLVMVLGNVMSKKIKPEDADLVSDASFFVGTLFFSVMVLLMVPQNLIPHFTNWGEVVSVGFMAIFSSIFALMAFQRALKSVEISEANVFTYLQPLFGIPASILFLHEKFSVLMIIPSVIIALGIWLNVREKFAKQK